MMLLPVFICSEAIQFPVILLQKRNFFFFCGGQQHDEVIFSVCVVRHSFLRGAFRFILSS